MKINKIIELRMASPNSPKCLYIEIPPITQNYQNNNPTKKIELDFVHSINKIS